LENVEKLNKLNNPLKYDEYATTVINLDIAFKQGLEKATDYNEQEVLFGISTTN